MMQERKIRVMIVDDSTIIRRLLTQTLSEDPAIEVIGTAPNGKIALAKIPKLAPDVVTLDIEMPEMDGLQTLTELRKVNTSLPVVMFSTLTQRGAEGTFDALEKGANDYVAKPANVGSVTEAMRRVRGDMVPKLKALCPWYGEQTRTMASGVVGPLESLVSRPTLADATQSPVSANSMGQLRSNGPTRTTELANSKDNAASTRPCNAKQRIDIIAIGISTGGPNALAQMLPELPGDLPVPVVIVQHMPPLFTKYLADRLNQKCQLTVCEAQANELLVPGRVYIAPGDFHMTTVMSQNRTRIVLNQAPPENSVRPAVDVLFRSVAKCYGRHVLACVLTGMGSDGLAGCCEIAKLDGHIIAQDRATSVVWGMPAAVTNAGLANQILPLGEVAAELSRHAFNARRRPTFSSAGA